MNIKQAKYLDMLVVVENYFIVDSPIAILPPAFNKAVLSLTEIITSIRRTVQSQGQVITGISGDKAVQKNNLVLLVTTVAGIIYAWSSDPLNNTIRNQVTYSLSDLKRLKDADLVAVCLNILALANDNIKELESFGLLDEQIQSLSSAIQEYISSGPLFRNAITQRLAYSKALAKYFKQADNLLKDFIDKMMLTFRFKDPNTYAKYASNRNIITSGGTITQLKGKVISADSLIGLKNVLITLISTNQQQTTSSFGVFSFKALGIGKYSIALSTPGYQDLVVNDLIVKQGKLNIQKITMYKK